LKVESRARRRHLSDQKNASAPTQKGSMAWDRVHTVNDYYDGPRRGIADVDGVPHIYEAEFDYSSDEFGDTYFASPVDENLFALVMEDWEIWLRWDSARKQGDASIEIQHCLGIARDMRLSKSLLGIA
jgi:hypothetical protein